MSATNQSDDVSTSSERTAFDDSTKRLRLEQEQLQKQLIKLKREIKVVQLQIKINRLQLENADDQEK